MKNLEQLPPPPPENPAVELLRLLTAFSAETRQWIYGSEQKEGLVRICKDASAEFEKNIFQTAPNFRPFKDANEEKQLGRQFNISLEDTANDNASRVDADLNTSPIFLLDVREYVAK